ncbi:MAG: nucleoside deaminase [Bacteroidota bacterium]
MDDLFFLRQAIALGEQSAAQGFDPFGAVLVKNGQIVASSMDQSIRYGDPTAHAELVLISEYCRREQLINLRGYTLYANVEPCMMCSGAIHWAKLDRVVFSVPQSRLQKTSGGRPKPTCADLLSIGGKKIEVVGPLILEEGEKVLENYQWRSKQDRFDLYLKDK